VAIEISSQLCHFDTEMFWKKNIRGGAFACPGWSPSYLLEKLIVSPLITKSYLTFTVLFVTYFMYSGFYLTKPKKFPRGFLNFIVQLIKVLIGV
jgi:hypothetical protein